MKKAADIEIKNIAGALAPTLLGYFFHRPRDHESICLGSTAEVTVTCVDAFALLINWNLKNIFKCFSIRFELYCNIKLLIVYSS